MTIRSFVVACTVWVLSSLGGTGPIGAEVRICAAANLRGTLDEIVRRYEQGFPDADAVTTIYGSTGKLYAQIVHGAPFDLFLSADADHPLRLERDGLAISDTRFTYAIGRVALWSAESTRGDPLARLRAGDFEHLAIASPRLAPYGRAALEVLEAEGLGASVEARLVFGEDVGKTFHFVESGAADLGFVPLALAKRREADRTGTYWTAPSELHNPIEQQAVLLTDSVGSRSFLTFLKTPEVRDLFESHGYADPESAVP